MDLELSGLEIELSRNRIVACWLVWERLNTAFCVQFVWLWPKKKWYKIFLGTQKKNFLKRKLLLNCPRKKLNKNKCNRKCRSKKIVFSRLVFDLQFELNGKNSLFDWDPVCYFATAKQIKTNFWTQSYWFGVLIWEISYVISIHSMTVER